MRPEDTIGGENIRCRQILHKHGVPEFDSATRIAKLRWQAGRDDWWLRTEGGQWFFADKCNGWLPSHYGPDGSTLP